MRILLDAHVSGRTVGKALGESGHDVRALDSEIEFEGLSDPEVLELAAAEGRSRYESPSRRHPESEKGTDGVPQPTPEETSSPNSVKQPQTSRDPVNDPTETPPPEAPNPYDAALALNTCLPDGQKVPKDALLQDAARELGHPKLTRKVKTALNKALDAEHNAGRLKTDWQLVWKPRKK